MPVIKSLTGEFMDVLEICLYCVLKTEPLMIVTAHYYSLLTGSAIEIPTWEEPWLEVQLPGTTSFSFLHHFDAGILSSCIPIEILAEFLVRLIQNIKINIMNNKNQYFLYF